MVVFENKIAIFGGVALHSMEQFNDLHILNLGKSFWDCLELNVEIQNVSISSSCEVQNSQFEQIPRCGRRLCTEELLLKEGQVILPH